MCLATSAARLAIRSSDYVYINFSPSGKHGEGAQMQHPSSGEANPYTHGSNPADPASSKYYRGWARCETEQMVYSAPSAQPHPYVDSVAMNLGIEARLSLFKVMTDHSEAAKQFSPMLHCPSIDHNTVTSGACLQDDKDAPVLQSSQYGGKKTPLHRKR